MSAIANEVEATFNPLGVFAPHVTSSPVQGLEASSGKKQMQDRISSSVPMDWFSMPISLNELLEQDFLGDSFGVPESSFFG